MAQALSPTHSKNILKSSGPHRRCPVKRSRWRQTCSRKIQLLVDVELRVFDKLFFHNWNGKPNFRMGFRPTEDTRSLASMLISYTLMQELVMQDDRWDN